MTRDGALNDADLMAKFEAVSEAAGFRPVDPGAISRGVKAVQDWVAAGYDFDEVVLPTIRKSVAEDLHGRGHTRTLGRFRQAIAGEHARSAARKGLGKRPDPPASPILDPKGEDPMFKPLRQALLERWGPHAYCVAANDVRFEAVDDAMNGSRPLRVIADERSNSSPRIKNGEYVATLRAVAKAHGFDAVW